MLSQSNNKRLPGLYAMNMNRLVVCILFMMIKELAWIDPLRETRELLLKYWDVVEKKNKKTVRNWCIINCNPLDGMLPGICC